MVTSKPVEVGYLVHLPGGVSKRDVDAELQAKVGEQGLVLALRALEMEASVGKRHLLVQKEDVIKTIPFRSDSIAQR